MDPLTTDVIDLVRNSKRGLTDADLADSLSVSKNRVHRALDELRGLGYRFDSDEQHRMSITQAPDRMIDIEIMAGLKTRTFARQLHCYQKIGSTNSAAIDLAEAGAPEGTVVVAEEQTKGRGRLGRSWHSPAGLGIWSSIILRPPVPPERATGLSLLAALAFARATEAELGLETQLKWPNDGLIAGRKVCGILIELSAEVDRVHYAVCGTGINVNHTVKVFPAALRKTASSLAIAAGRPVDRLAYYRRFLATFEGVYREYRREGMSPILGEYRKRSILLGKKVTVRQGERKVTGTAVAIDDTGALVVKTRSQEIVVRSGEATLR